MKHSVFDRRGFSLLETLMVVAITGIIAAVAVPMMANALGFYRLSGDARSVSNATAVAKMRGAAEFTRVRLYVDLAGRTHHIETWNKATCTWGIQGGSTGLSSGVRFVDNFASMTQPSPSSVIAQAPACTTSPTSCAAPAVTNIANTACVIFNSRGVPIDTTGAPTGADAIYLTDGTAVYGITLAATGMIRSWRAGASGTNWVPN